MNLLILYTKSQDELFNRQSAIGSYIYCLSTILAKEGYNVFLNGTKFKVEKTTTLEISHNKSRSIIKKLVPAVIKRLLRDYKQLKNVDQLTDQLLKSGSTYNAILEFYNLGSNVGLKLSKFLKIPLYITYDSPILEEYLFFNGKMPFFKHKTLKRELDSLNHAKKIVVYSNPVKVHLEKRLTTRAEFYIHQNVDFSRFDIQTADKEYGKGVINICFIGSFLKWHQVDLLVVTFIRLIRKGYKLKLFLVGDGLERRKIQELVNSYESDIREKILFTGFLDGEELYKLKSNMHIGVMPGSNWYGAPNKIFEYGAMKMAVVAPKTLTIMDLFGEDELAFFEWKDAESLFNVMESLLSDKEAVRHMATQLNNLILERYSEENTIKFYKEILK